MGAPGQRSRDEVSRTSRGLNATQLKIGVYVIAVVVIGEASLSGGLGSMLNTFIGRLINGVLNYGVSLLNVSPNLQPVVIGVAIILAVLTDRDSRGASPHDAARNRH